MADFDPPQFDGLPEIPAPNPSLGQPFQPPPPPPPVPASSFPPPSPAPPVGGYATDYPEASQAVTVFVLGILGVVACQVLAPFAWVLGNKELAAIDAGRRPPTNRGLARAGQVLGIIMSVFIGLFLILIVMVLIAGA